MTRLELEDAVFKLVDDNRITYVNTSRCWIVSAKKDRKEIAGSGVTRTLAIQDLYDKLTYQNINDVIIGE